MTPLVPGHYYPVGTHSPHQAAPHRKYLFHVYLGLISGFRLITPAALATVVVMKDIPTIIQLHHSENSLYFTIPLSFLFLK